MLLFMDRKLILLRPVVAERVVLRAHGAPVCALAAIDGHVVRAPDHVVAIERLDVEQADAANDWRLLDDWRGSKQRRRREERVK